MRPDSILLFAALLPVALLLRYIYRKDTIEKEPPMLLLRLFLFGVLACIPAATLEQAFGRMLDNALPPDSLEYHLINAFAVVALIEEGLKFLFLKQLTWHSWDFNYRFDGIVYAVFISLGFAAFENIFYVYGYGLTAALPRMVLAVPAHMGFAVYMGAFYGQARLAAIRGKRAKSRRNLAAALLVAVILHGFYDFCLFLNTSFTSLLFFLFVIIMYIVTVGFIRKQSREDSNFYL